MSPCAGPFVTGARTPWRRPSPPLPTRLSRRRRKIDFCLQTTIVRRDNTRQRWTWCDRTDGHCWSKTRRAVISEQLLLHHQQLHHPRSPCPVDLTYSSIGDPTGKCNWCHNNRTLQLPGQSYTHVPTNMSPREGNPTWVSPCMERVF